MGLVVLARSRDGLVDYVEDVETAFTSLVECAFEDLVAETVALDVHLCGGDAVDCTGNFEVHVAEVVLVTEDVAQDGIFGVVGVGDQTHSDTADRLLHLYAGIKKCESACTNGGH